MNIEKTKCVYQISLQEAWDIWSLAHNQMIGILFDDDKKHYFDVRKIGKSICVTNTHNFNSTYIHEDFNIVNAKDYDKEFLKVENQPLIQYYLQQMGYYKIIKA